MIFAELLQECQKTRDEYKRSKAMGVLDVVVNKYMEELEPGLVKCLAELGYSGSLSAQLKDLRNSINDYLVKTQMNGKEIVDEEIRKLLSNLTNMPAVYSKEIKRASIFGLVSPNK